VGAASTVGEAYRQLFYDWENEGEGFATAGASSANQVFTFKKRSEALSLDVKEGFNALGAEERLDWLAEGKIVNGKGGVSGRRAGRRSCGLG
jgi:hypothetical protein